jgi:peptide deformylase
MKLEILKWPNAFLTEVMPDFDFNNPIADPAEIEKNMLETQYAFDGLGLSANQVGIRARVFTMGHSSTPESGQAFFNPVVLEASTEIKDLEEGCLSFPGIYTNIKRPTYIVAQWQDKTGSTQMARFEGYDCKCYLHELDHLNGINFKDRVSSLKWAMAVKKSNKEKQRYVRTK